LAAAGKIYRQLRRWPGPATIAGMNWTAFAPLFAQVEMDPLSAALQSRGMVLVVLLVLVGLSVATWVVAGSRIHALRNLKREVGQFRSQFNELIKQSDLHVAAEQLGKKYVGLPHIRLLAAALKELHQLEQSGPVTTDDLDAIERALRRTAEPLVEDLESGLQLLATVASAGPFIGLFGTVWGIMGAFGGISDSGSMLQTVAPHIAQALVATAVGLLAAIPASMAYNYIGRQVRMMITDVDGFALELLNLVRRKHLRHHG